MKKQNYTLGQKLMAYILLISLFLQSCNNPYVGPSFNKQEPITKEEQPNTTPLLIETPPLAIELQEPIEKKELVNKSADSWPGDELATTAKPKALESQLGTSSLPAAQAQEKGLATKSRITTLKPRQLTQVSSKLSYNQKTKIKPIRERLQVQKLVHESKQQVKASSTSLIIEQTPQGSKQEVKKAPMLTKGKYQMTFEKTSEDQWKAIVNESFQVGISRKIELPVFFELGYNISHIADSHWVHVIEEGARSFIWVGSVGIKGGMYQEEDDNNNKGNRNNSKAEVMTEVIPSYLSGKLKYFYQVGSHLVGMVHQATSSFISNNSKAEVTTQPKAEVIPSYLSGKLKYLYQQDDTLPKLIEDEDIPAQSIQDYYVKLQVVLQENLDQARSAAAKDQVVGEKKPVEVDKLFDEIDKDHPAVSKILLLGGAGIGKSTLMHYISYQWAQGKLWKDKYEQVFRVRLKDLLDPTWAKRATKSDLLARFIYSCLDRQKTALAVKGNEQLGEIGYDLDEIQQLLKDPSKKEKVLLLVDGYDEITSLKGKPEYQKIVDLGIFKHPQVIMTSRPNAASKEIRAQFDRQVESQGLDEAGINEYISLQFKQEPVLGEKLKDFLASNSQVKSMCEVPINTALLCITWKDPITRAKLSSSASIQADFKLGQLYQELIGWLGKRHTIKYNPVHKDPKVLRELSDEAVLEEEVFKALERIAYQTFTGIGLENQSRQGGTLGIPGQLVDQLAKKEGKLSLSQLHQYGLLRGEGDPNKPLEQVYYFIHLTFQEYLTAHRLCKLLGQENKVEVAKVATWIAHHRNEPKYLMTFKFLAGLVSQSRDERLVKRFWEAVSCNVDGVIELGVEGKVKLFMHLLSPSKIGGQFDERIPHIAQIGKLVDSTLQGDLLKWEQAIIETGYYPSWLQEKASRGLAEGIGLARKVSLSEEARMRLQAAANLLCKMVNQGEGPRREQLFDQFMQLIALKDWQLQKLGLEKAREVVDQTVPAQKIEESAKYIVGLLLDDNLERAARGLFAKLFQIDKAVFKHLKPLLADSNYNVLSNTADVLSEIVKLVPELGKEVMEALKPLLDDKNKDGRRIAAKTLKKIVESAPGLGEEVWKALKPLLDDKNKDGRKSASDALKAIVQSEPGLGKEVLEALKPLLADADEYVRMRAADALGAIVQSIPGLRKEVLEALKPLLTHSDYGVRESTTYAFKDLVRSVPELGKEVWEALKSLLADSNADVRITAAYALIEIVPLVPGFGKKALEALTPLLTDKDYFPRKRTSLFFHNNVQGSAGHILREIVKLVPGKEVMDALKPLLAHRNKDVRESAAGALGEIVQSAPELSKEVIEALKPLLTDSNKDVRMHAAKTLRKIVESAPGLGEEVWKALKPLLADKDCHVGESAFDVLTKVLKLVPELGKEVWKVLKLLLAHSHQWVRKSAADALREIVKLVPELGKEVLDALKPLLADSNYNVRKSTADALREIVKLVPELSKEVMEALKPLLGDEYYQVRISAAYALKEIVPLVPELGKEVLKALKPLLAHSYEDVRSSAADALGEVVPLVPELGKEVLEALKPLLADSYKNVRSSAADALGEIVKLVPELGKEVMEALKVLLAHSNADVRISAADALKKIVPLVPALSKEVMEALKVLLAHSNADVRISAANALIDIVQSVPELRKEVMETLKPLLADKDKGVRTSAAGALKKIVKLVPELRKEVLEASKLLLTDKYWNVRRNIANALKKIVKLMPELGKEAIEALKPLLADSNYNVRKSTAADALRGIVPLVPFIQQVSLLTDAHPEVRNPAKEALAATLKSPVAIVQLNHQAVGSLLDIIRENRDQQEELAKALYRGATKGLASIAENLHGEGLSWLHEHLSKLQSLNLPEGQAFLKAVIHHSLQDGVIDLEEANLLIKCIIERGLTATINPQNNQIILEDNTYALQPASQANLTYVVNEVIRLSKDPMAQQYKDHKPLFTNSGEALPLATADIEKAASILDKAALDSDSWHVSVLDLSDPDQSKPSKTLILLEQRNYAGQHVVQQLELHQEKGKVSFYAINPLAVDEMKPKIFGELYLMKNPRYHGYSFTLSQKLGEELIKTASQMKEVSDNYSALHKLAGDYKAMQANQKEKVSDLLSLSWEAYSKNPAVKTYEREELYGKEIGLGGVKVQVNIETLNAENIEDLQVKNIGNVNTRNIEELTAKNVKKVEVKNLYN